MQHVLTNNCFHSIIQNFILFKGEHTSPININSFEIIKEIKRFILSIGDIIFIFSEGKYIIENQIYYYGYI